MPSGYTPDEYTVAQGNIPTWTCQDCVSYSLGDYLQATDFQDAVIDAIITIMIDTNFVSFRLVCCVYPSSLKDSAHRKLCRDLINTLNRQSFDFISSYKLPRDFLENVMTDIFLESTNGTNSQSASTYLGGKDKCEYHVHKRLATPCYNIKFGI
jgi:hypothetical protein